MQVHGQLVAVDGSAGDDEGEAAQELRRIPIGTGHLTRFGGTTGNVRATAKAFLENQTDDTLLSSTRALLVHRNCPTGKGPWNESDSVRGEFSAGFAETLQKLIDQQVARRARFLAAQKAGKRRVSHVPDGCS